MARILALKTMEMANLSFPFLWVRQGNNVVPHHDCVVQLAEHGDAYPEERRFESYCNHHVHIGASGAHQKAYPDFATTPYYVQPKQPITASSRCFINEGSVAALPSKFIKNFSPTAR